MTLYALGERRPELRGEAWVAETATVIGNVLLEAGASVWFNAVLRGDNELITLGENVNVQDGSVIHTDLGLPVVLERNVTGGQLVMLPGRGPGILIYLLMWAIMPKA